MRERQMQLLKMIVKEHVKDAKPVGSKLLSGAFELSSATIRNEMNDLEKEGYICQPHTSAGRVPTEKGYWYYIDNFLEAKKMPESFVSDVKRILSQNKNDQEKKLKNIARFVSDYSEETVIVAFSKDSVYYTGISNLLGKPEFFDPTLICNIGKIVDGLDGIINDFFDAVEKEIDVKVGSKNPFGDKLSVVATKLNNGNCLFAILGTLRMDYDTNYSILKQIKEIF